MKILFLLCLFPFNSMFAEDLKITSFTADDSGFYVNSHLISGDNESILIDAQFNLKNSRNLVAFLNKSQKTLTTVFITHAHPDHYFGLTFLKSEFPNLKILASAQTVAEIQKTSKDKLKFWSQYYKDDLPLTITVPEISDSKAIKFGQNVVEKIELTQGESEFSSVFFIPSANSIITGDLVYSGVHLWLAEGRPDGWLKNLVYLQSDKFSKFVNVFPGHGKNGGRNLFKTNETYIKDFVIIAKEFTDAKTAADKMVQKYPTFLRPDIAGYSAAALVK